MAIWLLKTEPSDYSIVELEREGRTRWDGVSNPLALKHLRTIERGDLALIYHTGGEKAWVGTARVVRSGYINPDAGNPKSIVIDVEWLENLAHPVSLAAIKRHPEMSESDLVRLGRLSVVPITPRQWEILQLVTQPSPERDDLEKEKRPLI